MSKVLKYDQLVYPSMLYEYGLCINKTYGLIICASCEIALEVHAIFYHLRNIHKIKTTKLHQSDLDVICDQYNIPATFIPIQGPVPQIQGLTLIRNGHQCLHCGLMSTQRSIIEKHHRRMHVKDGLETHIKELALQRLSSLCNSRKYFSVQLAEDPAGSSVEVHDLRQKCDAAYASFKPSHNDDRIVSPWLLTTRWPEHFATYDLSKLRKLVEFPSRNEDSLVRLEKGVLAVMQGGLGFIVKTPVLVLQELNSPDPVKM